MAEAAIAIGKSETSETSNVQGKECTVGKFITEQDGWKIIKIAATWEGTPYRGVGGLSVKGVGGDCSGSTNKIYIEAGFPYPYKRTADFEEYVEMSHRFRKIDIEKMPLQAGDILFWSGHMALYAPFPDGHPKRDTGLMKKGVKKFNNMYTAFNANTTKKYDAFNSEVFRGDKYKAAYRYFLLPNPADCKK